MSDNSTIRVVPFTKDDYTPADHSGPPLFTWREYYRFPNDLLHTLRRHGTVGPMGEMNILDNWEASEGAWQVETSDPDFFVVADMWNEHDRWNRVEASPWLVNTTPLYELIAMVWKCPGWCVYLALKQGGLTVLGDRVLCDGDLFANAASIADLGQRCALSRPNAAGRKM